MMTEKELEKKGNIRLQMMMLKNIPRLQTWIAEEELDLSCLRGLKRPIDYTMAEWFKKQCGATNVPLSSFFERWDPPDGQYKNWAVVLSTLLLVPETERKNSRGLIVGARAGTGSGVWIRFLATVMTQLGFTGRVEMWDKGLRDERKEYQSLVVETYEGYYTGASQMFTWSVDDIWFGGAGPMVHRAKYESFKDQAEGVPVFFHDKEGRKFFSQGQETYMKWDWQEGQCACPRCALERTVPAQVVNTLRYFDSRCLPGPQKYARDIELMIESEASFVPVNRAAQVAAISLAIDKGWRSGPECIVREPGDVHVEDGKLVGREAPKVEQKGMSTEPGQGSYATCGGDKLRVFPSVTMSYVADVAADIYYLPVGEYPEFVETGLTWQGHVGYKRRQLPPSVSKEEFRVRKKDAFGRTCFAAEKEVDMWCWRERRCVESPHICPDLDPRGRTLNWKGWCTRVYHRRRDDKDLCPVCDRTIASYTHKCPRKFCLEGVTDRSKLEREMALAISGQAQEDGYLGLPPAVEMAKGVIGIPFVGD